MKKTDMEWEEILLHSYKDVETPDIVKRQTEEALESIRVMERSAGISPLTPEEKADSHLQSERVTALTHSTRPSEKRSHVRFSWKRTAAIAAAACLVIGGSVFAAEKLYQMHLDHVNNYEDSLYLSAEEDIPDEVPEVTVALNYIPDGFTYNEEKGYYVNEAWDAGYSIGANPLLLDTAEPMRLLNVVNSRTLTIGGRDAILIEESGITDSDWLNTNIYVAYPEEYRVLSGWAWGHAEEEELIRMLEETELTASDTMVSSADLDRWSSYVSFVNNEMYESAEDTEDEENNIYASSDEFGNTHAMNESFPVMAIMGEDFDLSEEPIHAAVTDCSFLDSVAGLPVEEDLRNELGDLIAADGTILEDTLIYYKNGDGSSAPFMQTIREESTSMQLVRATIAYTNTSDQTYEDVYFNASMIPVRENNDSFEIVQLQGDDYDGVQNGHGYAGWSEMCFWDIDDTHTTKNYIPSLAPGETAYVHAYYLLDDYQLQDHLYLDPTGDSTYVWWRSTGWTFDVGLVKIR